MSIWNYRVVENEGVFAVHEAYYDEAGAVVSITAEPVAPISESLNEFQAGSI